MRLVALALLALLLGSCKQPTAVVAGPPGPVWPAPPESPRVVWTGAASTAADFGIELPIWARIGRFFSGAEPVWARLEKPFAIAVASDGTLYIADTAKNVVLCLDASRRQASVIDRPGGELLRSPVALAVSDDRLYVADSVTKTVYEFARPDGRLVRRITAGLERPSGICVIRDRLYVADSAQHCLLVYDLEGHALFRIGRRGAGEGEFNFPTALAASPGGRLAVVDSLNFRVQILDVDGHPLLSLGGAGDGTGHFSRPKGVAWDARENLYVTDVLFDNVQIFDAKGRFLLHFGAAGSGHGEFWMPAGLVVTADGRLEVADSYNHRIQRFALLPAP